MIDGLDTLIFGLLTMVTLLVILAGLRQSRRNRATRDHPVVMVPEGMQIGVVALTEKHADSWAKQRGLASDQYYFIDTVRDLDLEVHEKPLLYVAVNNYDRRADWPMLYGELAKRGFMRWWPKIESAESEQS